MVQQLNDKFVIFAGVPKSGSTSFYQYINDHPQIVGESHQEPRYFSLPPIAHGQQHSQRWKSEYLDNQIADYLNRLPPTSNEDVYRLSATVGYWTISDTAQIIHQQLPNAKLIFIFRDPTERFISWFRFQKQLHHVSSDATLEQFMNGLHGRELAEVYGFSAGNYAERLRPYWEIFEHDNILLLSFSELKNNPLQLMRRVCKFLDIDTHPYDNYEFIRHNASHSAKNVAFDRLQFKAIMWVRQQLLAYPKLFRTVSTINHRTWLPLYQCLNSKPVEKNNAPDNVLDSLHDYYKNEARLLYELTGVDGLLN